MTNLEIFKDEIEQIGNLDIKQFTIRALEKAPAYFWEIPASSSGKYHPLDSLGKGGLVRHTKKVVFFAIEICRAWEVEGDERDIAISASLLHDTLKSGLDNSGHTVDEHPLLVAEYYRELCDLTENYDDIMEAIKTHMGIWGPHEAGSPATRLQDIVHIADYIASRKEVYVNPSKAEEKDEPNFYLKHLREDLTGLMKNYLHLKEKEKEIKSEIEALRKIFLEKMEEAREEVLVSSVGVAKKNEYTRVSYDPITIKSIMKNDDLWQTILAVDNKKLSALIKDKLLQEEDLKMAVLEEKVVTYLRVNKR